MAQENEMYIVLPLSYKDKRGYFDKFLIQIQYNVKYVRKKYSKEYTSNNNPYESRRKENNEQ